MQIEETTPKPGAKRPIAKEMHKKENSQDKNSRGGHHGHEIAIAIAKKVAVAAAKITGIIWGVVAKESFSVHSLPHSHTHTNTHSLSQKHARLTLLMLLQLLLFCISNNNINNNNWLQHPNNRGTKGCATGPAIVD